MFSTMVSFFKASLVVLVTALYCSTSQAKSSIASAKCVQFGFKVGTQDYAVCVREYDKSSGGTLTKSSTPKPSSAPLVLPLTNGSQQGRESAEVTPIQREDKFWDDAVAIGNSDAFDAYLSKYPSGQYAGLARAHLARLKISAAGGQSATPPPSANSVASAPPASAPFAARNAGSVINDCAACPTMISVPAGEFMMGSSPSEAGRFSDEGPQHRVAVRSFSMGRTEVTQAQWRAVMGSNPGHFTSCGDDCPVEGVSWDEAQQFVVRLSSQTGRGYRLPSESEWEYACRAGSQQQYCGGGGDNVEDVAWLESNSGATTHAVALKRPNAWGLYDMSGNVGEWTQDCWNANYNGAPTNGLAWAQGDCSQRVVRGGSWGYFPRGLRAACRGGGSAALRGSSYGFRVARTD